MSSFQSYAFRAVDHTLDEQAIRDLQQVCSKAEITPAGFSNPDSYSGFRGDPRDLVARYFEAFVSLSNWGTRRLILSIPTASLDLETVKQYEVPGMVRVTPAGWN